MTADEVIAALKLAPHPEGGTYVETFRDAASTAIYFLLRRGEQSHWHRIPQVELWHHHAGAPLELQVPGTTHVLGSDLAAGQRPMAIVPGRVWQSARSLGDWTLVGCTVAPPFDFKTFELRAAGMVPVIGLLVVLSAVPLVPADAGFDTVLVRPRDPTRDALPADGGEEIRQGYLLFTDTAKHLAPLTANAVSCRNCHLNAGQKEGALPLVGVAAVYPQPNKRAGRPFSLEDRVIGCLLRSSDVAGSPKKLGGGRHENAPDPLLKPDSKPVREIAAYLRWLSDGFPAGAAVPWRGKNEIAKDARIAVEKLDPKAGQAIFEKTCVACHAQDGQGVPLGDFKPGPLWGDKSWNDGAGLARIYTMAGYLRFAMPYLAPGSLTDVEAQQVAAYLCGKPRPSFADKGLDYLVEPLPPDAVYYPARKAKSAAPVKATP